MPLFSRMGPYDTDLLRRAAEQRAAPDRGVLGARRRLHAGRAVAAHAAPDARLRGARPRVGGGPAQAGAGRLAARRGRRAGRRRRPRDLDDGLPRTKEHWGWNWSETKKALEYLFAGRRAGRRRPQQRLRAALRPARAGASRASTWTPPSRRVEEASVELLRRAAVAHGVGTEFDLRDYFRMRPQLDQARARRRWSSPASCCRCAIEGWDRPAYLHRDAALPRRVRGPRAAQPVRPGGLGARAHRAAVRLPLPDRDLRARAQAGARLLRAAVPARRPDRRPGRPQGRPARPGAAGARGRSPSPARPRRPPTSSPPSCATWPAGCGLDDIEVAPRGDLAAELAVAVKAGASA